MSYDLKSEVEVKEFIENLGIEYRFGCYHEKKPEVCHLLADYLESVKKDFEKAARVYKSNCDDMSFGKSCYKYGNYAFMGKGKRSSEGNHEEALVYFEKGCNLNDADSCLHGGLMRVSNTLFKNIKRDIIKGFEMLEKSCESKNAGACYYISGMYITGVKKTPAKNLNDPSIVVPEKQEEYVLAKDMAKAFDYTKKACELKNMYACANLAQMYLRGDGTEKNEDLGNKFKIMALEMQEELKKKQSQLNFQQDS